MCEVPSQACFVVYKAPGNGEGSPGPLSGVPSHCHASCHQPLMSPVPAASSQGLTFPSPMSQSTMLTLSAASDGMWQGVPCLCPNLACSDSWLLCSLSSVPPSGLLPLRPLSGLVGRPARTPPPAQPLLLVGDASEGSVSREKGREAMGSLPPPHWGALFTVPSHLMPQLLLKPSPCRHPALVPVTSPSSRLCRSPVLPAHGCTTPHPVHEPCPHLANVAIIKPSSM